MKYLYIPLRFLAFLLRPFCRYSLVASPASAGSLGDQALMQPVQDQLGTRRLQLKQVLIGHLQPIPLRNPQAKPLQLYPKSRRSKLEFACAMLFSKHFIVLGADVFDGRYDLFKSITDIELANIASRLGKPVRFIGFSFSNQPAGEVVEAAKNASNNIEFFLRDPRSYQRFLDKVAKENALLVADNAFNLQPALSSPSAISCLEWLESRNSSFLLGVNINTLSYSGDPQQAFRKLAKDLTELMEAHDVDLVFIPHDYREGQSDFESLKGLYRHIPEMYQEQIFCLDESLNAWDVKSITAHLDVVLTGRMHLAIAALGQGIPAIGISYADKFEGLYDFFELDTKTTLISPEQAFNEQGQEHSMLFDMLLSAYENAPALKATIQNNLHKVKCLSKLNLDGI